MIFKSVLASRRTAGGLAPPTPPASGYQLTLDLKGNVSGTMPQAELWHDSTQLSNSPVTLSPGGAVQRFQRTVTDWPNGTATIAAGVYFDNPSSTTTLTLVAVWLNGVSRPIHNPTMTSGSSANHIAYSDPWPAPPPAKSITIPGVSTQVIGTPSTVTATLANYSAAPSPLNEVLGGISSAIPSGNVTATTAVLSLPNTAAVTGQTLQVVDPTNSVSSNTVTFNIVPPGSGGTFPTSHPTTAPAASNAVLDGMGFVRAQSYRFGTARAANDQTVSSGSDLGKYGSGRFIYGGGGGSPTPSGSTENRVGDGVDGLYGNFAARLRDWIDYPDGDPGSLHVWSSDHLTIGGRYDTSSPTSIFSGMWRAFKPVIPNQSAIRARYKSPSGAFSWPAFWLNPGVEGSRPAPGLRGRISELNWPPEIDICDAFNNSRIQGTIIRPGEITSQGGPYNWALLWDAPGWTNNSPWDYIPPGKADGWWAADYHEEMLVWIDGVLTYYLDGVPFTQRRYDWTSLNHIPAHVMLSNQPYPLFNPAPSPLNATTLPAAGQNWLIDYLEVFQLPNGSSQLPPNPGNLSPAPVGPLPNPPNYDLSPFVFPTGSAINPAY